MTPADSTPTPSGPPPGTSRRRLLQSVLSALLVIVVVALTWWLDSGGTDDTATPATTSSAVAGGPGPTAPATANPEATEASDADAVNPDIPAHVRRTLMLIDDGSWPAAADAPGTRGGDTFRNAERRLPRTAADGSAIRYREWDVNPKLPGRNRDAERIVTGDDGSAWYTDDHYRSFVSIRGPDL